VVKHHASDNMPLCLLLAQRIRQRFKALDEISVFFEESSKIVLTQPIAYGKRTPVIYRRIRVAIRRTFSLLTTEKSSKDLSKLEI
jgi:hypothetical protein